MVPEDSVTAKVLRWLKGRRPDSHGDAAKLDAIRGLLADTNRSAQEKVNRISEMVGMGPSGP